LQGTTRVAYLPDVKRGRKILEMLRIATGEENVVAWNDIHHKTNMEGGQQRLDRLRYNHEKQNLNFTKKR